MAITSKTQQKNESSPIGIERVEKTIRHVIGHAAAFTGFESAKLVYPRKDYGIQETEYGPEIGSFPFSMSL